MHNRIDRVTQGAVPNGLRTLAALEAGQELTGDLWLRNFACWQLGLLALVGQWLRGRKFYFHQDPVRAVRSYRERWTWMRPPLVPVKKTECVRAHQLSRPFTLHFRDLPIDLLALLRFALCPPGRVRHKLGGLKPLGFGSVEFVLEQVHIEARGLGLLDIDPGPSAGPPLPDVDALRKQRLIHDEAWTWLQHILWCPERLAADHRLFLYPPYRQASKQQPLDAVQKGFAQVLTPQVVPPHLQGLLDNEDAVKELIKTLYADARRGKQALHLPTYQANARFHSAVCGDGGPSSATMTKLREQHF